MKKFLAMLLAVLFVSVTSSMALAQDTNPAPVIKKHEKTMKKIHKKKHHTKKKYKKGHVKPTPAH